VEEFSGKIIDISLPLEEETITYPGIEKVRIDSRKSPSGSTIVSAISMNTHSGTHIDAPSHIPESRKAIDEIPLGTFIGPCRVLNFSKSKESIKKSEIIDKDIQVGERILLKTSNSARGFEEFYDDYVYLSTKAADYLAEIPVKLIGIDSLSIKQSGSRGRDAHNSFLEKDIPIIEGLNLRGVKEGEYTLVAFPLAFTGIDGAPARVVLIEN